MTTPTPIPTPIACAANRQAVAAHYRVVARALDELRQYVTIHAPALTGEPVNAFVPTSGPGSVAWMVQAEQIAWRQAEEIAKAAKWIADEAAEDVAAAAIEAAS